MKRTVGLFVLSPTSRLVRKATGHYRLTCRLPSARNVPLEKELLIPLQEKKVSYTCGQLFLIMCHHNHGLVLTTTESFYHIFHQPAVVQVQPMQRLIQNKPPSARDADVCTTPQNHVVRLPQYLWQEGSSDKRDASQD